MRYEPPTNNQVTAPLLDPSQPTPEYATRPAAPRYQPLNLESAPVHSPRSPFVCAGCFNLCFNGISDNFGKLLPGRAAITGYFSGFLFAIGWWIFIDGLVFNTVKFQDDFNKIAFEDWLPGLLSTLALIVVNLIDRESLNADDSAYDGTHVAMKARACAFTGITIALGSLGGALAILSLKYLIPGKSGDALYLVI